MIYEELHRRYGGYIAQRLRQELKSEIGRVDLGGLLSYLEDRAEAAHAAYKHLLDDPLALQSRDCATSAVKIDQLYNIWRDAEDLSYLITIAESVHSNMSAVS